MSMRADFFGALQNDEPLFAAHRQIDVPPLREAQLREVVNRPAELLSARFETDHLAADIARRTAEEFGQGRGRVAAALLPARRHVDRRWSGAATACFACRRQPWNSAACSPNAPMPSFASTRSRRKRYAGMLTLKLATVREDGEPTRRRALRSEFSDEEWRLVIDLADHPNRLLVTATPEGGETYAEVAHEAIFRRWDTLRDWIAAERDFLAWRSGLEAARRAWEATPDGSKNDALLMGAALTQAQSWLAMRRQDLPVADRDFIDRSVERESKARRSGAARAGPHLRAAGRHHRRAPWRGSIRRT